jgi:hypothetical protein
VPLFEGQGDGVRLGVAGWLGCQVFRHWGLLSKGVGVGSTAAGGRRAVRELQATEERPFRAPAGAFGTGAKQPQP